MTDVVTDQVSRRSLLKKAGAGMALAWTAPVLLTVMSPAGAVTQEAACRERAKNLLPACAFCADTICEPDVNSGFCFCLPEVTPARAGCCFCGDLAHAVNCDALQNCSQTGGSGGCPSGSRCLRTCCDVAKGFRGKCIPACPAPVNGFAAASAPSRSEHWYVQLIAARNGG